MKSRLGILAGLLCVFVFAAVPAALADTGTALLVVGSVATIQTLAPGDIGAAGAETGTLSISVRTNWVDTRGHQGLAEHRPGGLYNDASQWKLQIAHTAGTRTRRSAGEGTAHGESWPTGRR